MLTHRLITGPILLAAVLAVIWCDQWLQWHSSLPRGIAIFAVLMIAMSAAALELTAIYRAQGIAARSWLTVVAAIAGLLISHAAAAQVGAGHAVALVSSAMALLLAASLLVFSRGQNVHGVVAAAGAVLFAMVYLGLLAGFFLALRREHSAWVVAGVLLVTKACDSGAYFTGRLVGRHKMIPWLSPGKTWEGLIGGILAAALAGCLLALAGRRWSTDPADHYPAWLGAVAGAIFAVVGQLGDLTMSLLKRGAGKKDSSRLLPGLGGVLDVLDSPLMVAPVAFWLLA